MNLERWTDERLDDLSDGVKYTRDGLMRLAVFERDLAEVRDTGNACLERINEVDQKFDDYKDEIVRNRRSDMRWLVATVLTASGIVVTALGIWLG